MSLQRKSPRSAKPRAENRKAFDVQRKYSFLARHVKLFLCRLRLKLAERAISRPFNTKASLRLDTAVVALEEALRGDA